MARRWGTVWGVAALLLLTSLGVSVGTFLPNPAALRPSGTGAPSAIRAGAMAPEAASMLPETTPVNPFHIISREPAPMGVADFGVTAASGSVHAYSYFSPEFQGNVLVRSMYTTAPGAPSSYAHYMTFQLNVVAVMSKGSTNYSYWIQDVASIDSSTNLTGWIDNIWNLSSSTAGFKSGELSGNGAVNNYGGLSWYADSPGSNYPGSGVYLRWPTNITLRVVTSTFGLFPRVAFQYNDGYGWVSFDNVTFEALSGFTDLGFSVNGYEYTPVGIFYDAEWVYAGSGSGQYSNESNLDMTLDFWNGHNWQAVPNAWNFGSDTAESLSNVVAAYSSTPSDGSLYSHLSTGGGSLGLLYNSSEVSYLNVSTPNLGAGTLEINGTPHYFVAGAVNLTLAPGEYNVSLWNGSVMLDAEPLTLVAGGYLHVTMPFVRFPVRFVESGLPAGTAWTVRLGSATVTSSTPTVNFTSLNGSYNFSVGAIPGFINHAPHGTVQVQGVPLVERVAFFPFNYSVVFQASGLPKGAPWSVTLDSQTLVPLGTFARFDVPNGTHPYKILTLYAYVPVPDSGAVQISGFPASVAIEFGLRLGNLTIAVSPADATVWIDGGRTTLSGGEVTLSLVPSVYSLEVARDGYTTQFLNVSVTPGNTTFQNVTLAAQPLSQTGSQGGPGALLSNPWLWIGAALVVIAGVLVVGLRRPRRNRPVTRASGSRLGSVSAESPSE